MTAFEIALELLLKNLERRHGHSRGQHSPACEECKRIYEDSELPVNLLDLAEISKMDVREAHKAKDRYDKAIVFVLAVCRKTFRPGMDPEAFDKQHKEI